MKLPAQQMTQLTDAQLNFEYLQKIGVMLGSNNLSDVVSLLATLKNLKLTWGVMRTNNPPTIASAGSGDWSLAGSAVGVSSLTYPTRAGLPAVIATPASGSNITVGIGGLSTSGCVINTFTANTAAAVGTATSFIVLGI